MNIPVLFAPKINKRKKVFRKGSKFANLKGRMIIVSKMNPMAILVTSKKIRLLPFGEYLLSIHLPRNGPHISKPNVRIKKTRVKIIIL
jgi:hypothetical protein